MSSRFLLKGGCVLTLGLRTPNFLEADVLIEGDRIAEVGPGLRARDSEQVDTMLAVATTMADDGSIVEAGGYMVQLLPEVGRAPLAVMAARLEDFQTIDHLLTADFNPDLLLSEILYGMSYTRLDESDVSFTCWCSTERQLTTTSSSR